MIDSTQRLSVNSDEVAGEVVESEAILINFGTGMYYTLDKVGADVWQLLEGSHTVAEMTPIIAERYGVDADRVARDLDRVVQSLLDERLVVPDGQSSAPSPVSLAPLPADATYAEPELHTYQDMAQILALDPPLPVLKDPWQKAD